MAYKKQNSNQFSTHFLMKPMQDVQIIQANHRMVEPNSTKRLGKDYFASVFIQSSFWYSDCCSKPNQIITGDISLSNIEISKFNYQTFLDIVELYYFGN